VNEKQRIASAGKSRKFCHTERRCRNQEKDCGRRHESEAGRKDCYPSGKRQTRFATPEID
jgi:hypothetical protein